MSKIGTVLHVLVGQQWPIPAMDHRLFVALSVTTSARLIERMKKCDPPRAPIDTKGSGPSFQTGNRWADAKVRAALSLRKVRASLSGRTS
jgi:hypothetical protein